MNFDTLIINNEKIIRMSFFLGILIMMALWEIIAPRRSLTISKTIRWINNLGLVFLNTFLLRLIFPAAAVGIAAFTNAHGWGLFNYYQVPYFVSVISSVILFSS